MKKSDKPSSLRPLLFQPCISLPAYELPSGNDRFDLEVTPPFGQEDIVLYAGTAPFCDINM